MDVSIIIVNYKTACLLANAVESIFDKTTGVDFEVIVVDNASGDDCGSLLARKFKDRVTYVGLNENIGFGRANNEGARFAKGRNLFFKPGHDLAQQCCQTIEQLSRCAFGNRSLRR